MEEEVHYVTVTCRSKPLGTLGKENNMEIIYDEVKTEKTWDTHFITETRAKSQPHNPLSLVVAALGIICLILVSVIVALSTHFTSEQKKQNRTLTEQNLQLWTEKAALQREMKLLSRERDGLNWTMGVILEYRKFPVTEHCPHKVCKPCLDNWVLFQSNCYLFANFKYYSSWRSWDGSQRDCREQNADLVVINSHEEQDFIKKHIEKYQDDMHGYWIGLSNNKNTWTWVDGSNVTVKYWVTKRPGYSASCALSKPAEASLANWDEVGCDMRNRWICETKALIRPD